MAHEAQLFFRQLLTQPKQISAIAPSSPWLARAMAEGLGPQTGRVVEFGPGTGVLTRGVLAAGVAPENLTLFEMSADFVGHLRLRFPEIHHPPRPCPGRRPTGAQGRRAGDLWPATAVDAAGAAPLYRRDRLRDSCAGWRLHPIHLWPEAAAVLRDCSPNSA